MDYYLGVYQETTILLYFISSNANGMFYIFVQEEMQSWGECAAEPARLAVEYNRVWPLKQERELEKFKWDWRLLQVS